MKKISIITVCYNSAETIRDTIESVLSQDYPSIEYIIVDGASTDSTPEILQEFEDRIDCIISESDRGIYDAMNKGISRASGDFIGILNSDDVYDNREVISLVVSSLETSGTESLFADLCIVERFRLEKVLRYCSAKNFSTGKIRWGMTIPHPTFFVSRAVYERLGGYRLGYRVSADFELIARFLYCNRVSYSYLPRSIIRMRQGGVSTSGVLGRIQQNFEIVRACRENEIYTNIFMISIKIPFKLFEFLRGLRAS
ncbi:glycosyltransferase family 2 protein [Microbulbifer sp. 2201CG32-9]|uniref:glycosyltransferase family 2 protein n=1 Tax=Microbulbifer sp. 2201CG32-9 TaxID=3232309 RepID=UPI00345C1922